MLLNELFGKGKDVEDHDTGYRDGRETYKFTTSNGQEVVIDFLYDRKSNGYEAVFTINDQTKMTGGGEQFEILSTVLQAIKKFADKHPKSAIMFSADKDEPSRVKVYHRMVKRFVPNATIEEHPFETQFIIEPRE